MSEIPHLAVPFRVVGARAVTREQDSEQEIIDCVEAILLYRVGQRPEAPEFGVPDQAHRQGGADLVTLTDAVERFEDRVSQVAVSTDADPLGIVQRVQLELLGG